MSLGPGGEMVRTVVSALLIALALRIVLFEPFTIPSSSMEPGLQTGDYLIVSKFNYGWSRASIPFRPPVYNGRLMGRAPARGDVIVFQLPRDPKKTLVKRLIGLPGDRVQVLAGVVFINGQPISHRSVGRVKDPDLQARTVMQVEETKPNGRVYTTFGGEPGHEGDDTAAYLVPAGSYFFMGDNRDNSLDSRWPEDVGVGFVPAENIVGKAQVVLWSWSQGASLFKPWTWVLNLRADRVFRLVS